MKVKILHENISEEKILLTLVVVEVDEACILSQIIKVLINPGCSQELITRPFTRPNLRIVRENKFGLLIFFTLLIHRGSARRAPQQSLHHFLKISEIFSNSK